MKKHPAAAFASSTAHPCDSAARTLALGAGLLVALAVLSGGTARATPPQQMRIVQVSIELGVVCNGVDVDAVRIEGVSFANGDSPTVVLGDEGALEICDASDVEILAALPNGLPSGDYRVSVSTGSKPENYDEYDLKVGIRGYEMVVSEPVHCGFRQTCSARAYCSPGKVALGGGYNTSFSSADELAQESHPISDAIGFGWRADVRHATDTGLQQSVVAYAICAK